MNPLPDPQLIRIIHQMDPQWTGGKPTFRSPLTGLPKEWASQLDAESAAKAGLSPEDLAVLFRVPMETIQEHLSALYTEGAIPRVIPNGISVEAIFAVGFRVDSPSGIQFRKWATATLSDFAVKGYLVDHDRLAQEGPWSPDYFEYLLEELDLIRKSSRAFPRRDWKARRRLFWRATAADARHVMKPYRDPHKRLYAYKDLPAPKPITGPLRAEVDRLREDPEGWTFWVRAELVQEDGPPIELRGVWCFPVRDGYMRRFVERYALGIEAGVIVANMELRMDVYGNPFIHFDCQPWTERQPGLALRRIPVLEAGLAERGIPPWTGGPGSGRRRSREPAETVNASILCLTCRARSREEWI